MKLEIKNLVPYLPYGLKAEMLDYQKDYVGKNIDTIVGIHQWDKSGKLWSLLTEGGSKPSLDRTKPLLYPLEYLTKEIEVNGEKFVPIVELLKIKHKGWVIEKVNTRYNEIDFEINYNYAKAHFKFMATYSIEIWLKNIDREYYWIIQKLAEWHIDFQGLIPAGLAIDINSIKN